MRTGDGLDTFYLLVFFIIYFFLVLVTEAAEKEGPNRKKLKPALDGRRQRQPNLKIVIPPPDQVVGNPQIVFGNVVNTIQQSEQWRDGTPAKREQLLIKSYTKALKQNPTWFETNGLLNSSIPPPTPAPESANRQFIFPTNSNSISEPVPRLIAGSFDAISNPSLGISNLGALEREFYLGESDVRLQVATSGVRFVKERNLNSKFQRSVSLSHNGLRILANSIGNILEEYKNRTFKLDNGFINTQGEFRIPIEEKVLVVISSFSGRAIIHIRVYDSLGGDVGQPEQIIPTKDGITITPKALKDLVNRVLPILRN